MTSSTSKLVRSNQSASTPRERDKSHSRSSGDKRIRSSSSSSSSSKYATKDIDNQFQDSQKFEKILDTVVDSEKIDFSEIKKWLKYEFCEMMNSEAKLLIDLIIYFLRSEKYPDAKVLQLELADYHILSENRCKKLMKKLWCEILNQKYEPTRANKYQKISSGSPSESSSRVGSNSYLDYGQSHRHHHRHSRESKHL